MEAQKGNPVAFRALIEPYLPAIWSVCRSFHANESQAIHQTVAFRDRLNTALPSLATDEAFGLQLFKLLWTHLTEDLEPRGGSGITEQNPRPGRTLHPQGSSDTSRIRQTVLAVPPIPRLVYLFWLVTDLPAPALGELIGLPELLVRHARAQVATALQEALAQ